MTYPHLRILAKQLHLQICPYYNRGQVCLKYGVKKVDNSSIK